MKLKLSVRVFFFLSLFVQDSFHGPEDDDEGDDMMIADVAVADVILGRL